VSVVANVAINVDASKALGQLKAVDQASKGLDGGLKGAAVGAKGLGSAIAAALGPLLAFSTAVATVQKGLTVAFERGAAEQRLKNLASSTGEYEAALGVAAATADKFGMSQTEATQALADVYGRLKGVGFGLKETSEIYDGFNAIAKQSGIAGADAAGVFFQLSQALGKGKLNGDEFVSVSERMPQLLDAIAQATGRSRGELSKMAQDGEITSEVLYKALSGSAAAAGDLNGKLTEQQKAFNALSQVSDRLLNSIGQVFAPVVIKGAELFAALGKQTAEWWDYLGAKVFPKFLAAIKPATDAFQKLWSQIPWDTIVGYIQGAILVGIDRIITAVKILSPLVGFVVTKFAELAQNPVFRFIAEQVGRLVQHLGLSNTEVSKFTEGQKASEQAAAGTVNQYSSMPEKIKTAAEANSKLIESTNQVLENVKGQAAAIDAQIASLERGASINSARYEAEKAFNDLQGQQLERQYGLAKTAQQRLDIAIAIFNQQVKAAEIEYKQALENIQLEQRKQELQIQSAQLKYKEIEAEGQLQILKAGSAEEEAKKRAQLSEALATQNQVVQETRNQGSAQQQIAEYQKQTAAAQYESKVLAAQTALEQKLTSDQIGMSAEGATRLSGGLAQSASNAGQLAGAMNQVANQANAAANAIQRVNAARAANTVTAAPGKDISGRSIQDAIQKSGGVRGGGYAVTSSSRQTSASGQLTGIDRSYINADGTRGSAQIKAHFATGGYVTKPTDAMVGEGGEPEYIIPASKMQDAMKRYAEGKRGNGVIPSTVSPQVNVTTGPVMSMNGQNYVNQRDLISGLMSASRSTAESVIDMLRSDMSVRREIGLS
jgi:tape measure domain-containing protein